MSRWQWGDNDLILEDPVEEETVNQLPDEPFDPYAEDAEKIAKAYDPMEARDEHGRWTSIGGAPGIKGFKLITKRVWHGNTVATERSLSNWQKDKIGELVVQAHFKQGGLAKLTKYQGVHGTGSRNNYPLDLVGRGIGVEVKPGEVGNGASAQQWRAKIGTRSQAQQAAFDKASPAARTKFRAHEDAQVIMRKQRDLKALQEHTGIKHTGETWGLIVNPDTRTADLFRFKGFHINIQWRAPSTMKAYTATYRY